MATPKENGRAGEARRRLAIRGSPSSRIAVDIGGTFTDLVLIRGGRVAATEKVLTTPSDPSLGVETGVARLLRDARPEDVVEVVHGTTLVSNTLIERKGATTGLIATRGFRDLLTIRRELRYDLYDLFLEMPDPLVPRRLRWELSERVWADGSVGQPLDLDEVRNVARRIEREGVDALAICLLHSYVKPEHERRVAEALRKALPDVAVSLSSEVSPELGEYQRTSTTVANAYVLPLVTRYLESLQKRLDALGLSAPLHIMLSTGGLTTVEIAARFPVRLLESGPAAGVLSAGFWGSLGGHRNVLAFDMGGTTAKAALIENNEPLIARDHEAARVYRFAKGSGLPLRIPAIDLIEIGAGGGSIARVGPFGLPKVGPESAGAEPGPVCYGQGGIDPTVTDADLLLGYLNPEFFLGGEMRLDLDGTRERMAELADQLGLTADDAAAAIHRVVNENMASAARMHAIERGRDLRRFALVATGGAGPVHAWGVARGLGIGTVIFPPSAGVASAFGMLTAPPSYDFARSLPSSLATTDWKGVRSALASMVKQGERQLEAAGLAAGSARVSLAADVRYRGQGDAVMVDLGASLGDRPSAQVERAFGRTYDRLYGRRPPGVEPEIVTWRVRVSGPRPRMRVKMAGVDAGEARKGSRPVWFAESDGYVEADVYDRYRLGPGTEVRGPAVVEERESTAVVGPGSVARVDGFGNLEVQVG